MTTFVKKPIPVEAIRWEGNNVKDVKAWMDQFPPSSQDAEKVALFVKRRMSGMTEALFRNMIEEPADDVTAALWVDANDHYLGITDGEWIMHDEHGFYPCKSEPDGSAPLNYREQGDNPDAAEKALPSDIEVPEVQPEQETPQERGDRHADKLINDVFQKFPHYEHADFNAATSHLHTCAKTERSDNVYDKQCIHALYSLYDDLHRDTPVWVMPLVQWARGDIDILDFNKVEVPERLQGLLGHLPTIPVGETDGTQ